MTDSSSFTIEERLITSVWVHDRFINNISMEEIQSNFTKRFGKPPPTRANLYLWEKKAFETGSVLDRERSGRPSTRTDACSSVEESCDRSPTKSTRRRSAELGVPRTTMRRHMKEDLNLRAFKPMNINELSDDDMAKRKFFCETMLQRFRSPRARRTVLFTDECAIYRSMRARNIYMWAKSNPHFHYELEHNPPHVMIWAGVSADHLIGPYLFDKPVNQESYATMIKDWLIPELSRLNIKDTIWFQQDGAPAHYALSVRQLLNETFPSRWIGRGSDSFPSPISWPPRSPDLSTPDNSLWGIIKERVAMKKCSTNSELREAVIAAFATISADTLEKMSLRTWRRIQLCDDSDGAHTDPLDY